MRTPVALFLSVLAFVLVLSACSPDASGGDLTGPQIAAVDAGPQSLECGEEDEWGNVGICVECVPADRYVAAGADQVVAPGALVTLSGYATGDFGCQGWEIQGTWTQIAGAAVDLNGANTNSPSFTAPGGAAVLTFRLTASDWTGTMSDDVSITVLPNTHERFAALVALVTAANLEKNTSKSLLSLLQNAQASYDKGDTAGALDKLTSFIAQVSALKKKIPGQTQLIDAANALIAAISAE